MSEVFFAMQALLTSVLIGVVVERCRRLLFTAPVSRKFADAVAQSLDCGSEVRALRLVRAQPQAWVSRVVLSAFDGDSTDRAERIERVETTLVDLRLEAGARLALLRVSATISSTLGLMAGILAIQRGFSGKGLLSLSAGLAQQVALNQALTHMAVGMGTAAFCFAALGLFRNSARDLLAQVAHIAARCRGLDAKPAIL